MGLMSVVFAVMLALYSAEPAQEQGSVEGLVLRGGTTEGISGADVVLRSSAQEFRTTTNNDGRFSFSGLPLGRYFPVAIKEGYMEPHAAAGPAEFIELSSPETIRGVRLEILPYSTVSGRILGADGAPVEGVVVRAFREGYDSHGRGVLAMPGLPATTDWKGEFRKTTLHPGEYYIVAMPPEGRRDFAPVYYPGVTSLDDAEKVTVPPGRDLFGIQMNLSEAPLYRVRFALSEEMSAPDGPPVRVEVRQVLRDGFETMATLDVDVLSDRTFVVPRLAPGSYAVDITWGPGWGEAPRRRFEVTIVDRDVDLGTLNFGLMRSVAGTVAMSDGAAPPANVLAQGVSVRSWDFPLFQKRALLAADGTFRVDLPEGRYRITLPGLNSDGYIASVRHGEAETLDTGLVIDGSEPGPVTVGIRFGVGKVTGFVKNLKGEFIHRAQVVLMPARRRSNVELIHMTVTDASGTFSFRNVPPGDYSVIALEGLLPQDTWVPTGVSNAVRNPRFMEPFRNRETHVLVNPGAESSVILEIVSNVK